MLERKSARIALHVISAIAYALGYLALRETSNDQWYLPAGLRFAALLLMPLRCWPALYVGELAALAWVRYPMIPDYGLAYVIASPFFVWPVVAAIVYQLRKRTAAPFVHRATDAVALLIGALVAAELATLTNKAASHLLRSQSAPFKFSDLITYSLGDFQGIVLACFVSALWLGRSANAKREEDFRLEAMAAATSCAVLCAFVALIPASSTALLDAGRLLLLIPAIVLATRHGWRGAAAGAIASNIALVATISHQEAGQSDVGGLMMQETFTFVACALFVLGARIHERVAEATRSAAAADEARRVAKASYDSSELQLRDRALRAEQLHVTAQQNIRSTISWLRKNGHSEVAMGLLGAAHRQAQNFEQMIIHGMYPLTLERDGLFAALMSESFQLPFDQSGTVCSLDLTGSPHGIGVQTQLAAYRVIVEASEFMMNCSPERLQMRVRCSRYSGRGRISIAIYARGPARTARTAAETAQLANLRTRAAAYEGSFHSRAYRIRIILLDAPAAPAPQPTRWAPRVVSARQNVPMP